MTWLKVASRGLVDTIHRMPEHPHLSHVIDMAHSLAASLENPSLLVTLHRDIDGLRGRDGKSLGRSAKQYALRWSVFTMTYAATESFFNDVLNSGRPKARHLPLSPDKLRGEAAKQGVQLFTNDWGLRTRTQGRGAGNRSRWALYLGTQAVREYLADMKNLRDILSHGGDPFVASNASGALWELANGGHSMRLMGAEGFIQACTDLAAQTILAYGGDSNHVPVWPEPERSGLSAEKRPGLPLIP